MIQHSQGANIYMSCEWQDDLDRRLCRRIPVCSLGTCKYVLNGPFGDVPGGRLRLYKLSGSFFFLQAKSRLVS